MHNKPFTNQVIILALCSAIFIVPLGHCICSAVCRVRFKDGHLCIGLCRAHDKCLEECVYPVIFSGWFFSHVVEDLFGQVILSKWFLGFTYDLKNLFGRQN